MTSRLRLPFFLFALLVIASIVLVERGAVSVNQVAEKVLPFLKEADRDAAVLQGLEVFSPEQSDKLKTFYDNDNYKRPQKVRGMAIPSMRFVDGYLLFTILLMGLALIIPPEIHARFQGVVTLVFAIALIVTAVAWILVVLAKLLLMVSLLLSFPFGTIVYLAVYGNFPRSSMNMILGMLLMLKFVFGVVLLAAHQGFLKQVGLIIFWIVGLVGGLIVSFLYGLVPGILVSITDAIAALIVTVIGIILGLVLAIGTIPSILKIVKV